MSFCARVTGEGLAGSDPAEMVGGWVAVRGVVVSAVLGVKSTVCSRCWWGLRVGEGEWGSDCVKEAPQCSSILEKYIRTVYLFINKSNGFYQRCMVRAC